MTSNIELDAMFPPRPLLGPDSLEVDAIPEQVPTAVSAGTLAICDQSERIWIQEAIKALLNPNFHLPQEADSHPLQMHLRSHAPLYSYDHLSASYPPITDLNDKQLSVNILVRPTSYGKTIAFVYQGPLTGLLAHYSRSQLDHNGNPKVIANRWFNNSADIRNADSPSLLSEKVSRSDPSPNPSPIETFNFLLGQLGVIIDQPHLHYTQDDL